MLRLSVVHKSTARIEHCSGCENRNQCNFNLHETDPVQVLELVQRSENDSAHNKKSLTISERVHLRSELTALQATSMAGQHCSSEDSVEFGRQTMYSTVVNCTNKKRHRIRITQQRKEQSQPYCNYCRTQLYYCTLLYCTDSVRNELVSQVRAHAYEITSHWRSTHRTHRSSLTRRSYNLSVCGYVENLVRRYKNCGTITASITVGSVVNLPNGKKMRGRTAALRWRGSNIPTDGCCRERKKT